MLALAMTHRLPLPLRAARWVFAHTLDSVKFGILLLVLIAVYIALGSGLPGLREALEMNELQFFNWWPMRVLTALLVANLVFVTFRRIPFTPPRYGVWMIHTGIITLILGLGGYFAQKVEGLAFVPRGQTVGLYYDAHERALYATAGDRISEPTPLRGLPRFAQHLPGEWGGLDAVRPVFGVYDEAERRAVARPLGEQLGVGEDVTLRVLGYWPYAMVQPRYGVGEGGKAALRVELEGVPDEVAPPVQYLVAGDAGSESISMPDLGVELRHLHRDDLTGPDLLRAAQEAHNLRVEVGGEAEDHQVQPGTRHESLGYTIAVEDFDPAWQTIDGRTVARLTVLVTTPEGRTFRRMVLDGDELQTDFDLDADGAGPMGARQTEPIDDRLVLRYRLTDGLNLMPRGTVRHTLLTGPGVEGVAHLITTRVTPTILVERPNEFALPLTADVDGGPRLKIARQDGVVRTDQIVPVPKDLRTTEGGQSGAFQVVLVRVTAGDWQRDVPVAYRPWPHFQQAGAGDGPTVRVPGAKKPLRLTLANTARPMPAMVRLDDFEATPFMGGQAAAGFAMRDFASHVTIFDPDGTQRQATVKLNDPAFVDKPVPVLADESWLLFQSSWDPEGQRFTVLGVGNRPHVWTMIAGVALTVVGLMWAFYLKPVLLRRKKAAALRQHRQREATAGVPVGVPVTVG